ncbi:hypothetical protein A2442_00785 [Candidatus Campbellbacteria bacterium RIFOXYC2_FULL_35_25]|uniref:Cytidyltransferase-like domain-containing protein n=1 Tax=Candidatus Campbellbacteria bacterium RIFOXYC2_FULL_35_25 TaxID=1797582 RepID=A0A1F5EIR2_9BACT|nr:MAG: hypothetical protein A2442_00785 [Candidatus Campbellbacteria bacterium RIFOXYC2_FULL_35_25]
MRLCSFSSNNLSSSVVAQSVGQLISDLKRQGKKIVLTSGTFDLFHIGHAQYLQKAKDLGDVLIVGLDSDAKVKKRKGPDRPIVSEDERSAILSFVRPVDFIVLKDLEDGPMELIKTVKPDILVISKTTKHSNEKVDKMRSFCGHIHVLEAQSTTSTTAKVRRLFVDGAKKFAENLAPKLEKLLQEEIHNL